MGNESADEQLTEQELEIYRVLKRLKRFYNVGSLEELVMMQAHHIERLQARLPPLRDERPGYTPREG